MAYSASTLNSLASSGSFGRNGYFTLWHYKTSDLLCDIREAGYFNAASTMLRPGDVIFCNWDAGSSEPATAQLAVLQSRPGHVTVSVMCK